MKRSNIILLIILLIAAFFRVWQLSSIPPGLYPDEAINGNEAIINPGKLFYPENNGREGLFMNLINLSFSLFGTSVWSLRIVSAFFGILTVLGIYLLTKELFGQETTALLAAFFLAVSFWHINFSRIVFRAILVPFILVFAFYFLFKGLKLNKKLNLLIAGIFFGLGFYTYISYRFVVLLLPFSLIPQWLIYRKENRQKEFLINVCCLMLAIFIVALPIGFYFLQNPQDFMSRSGAISIFSAENPIKELAKSTILHLAMFNIAGDWNWRHNFSGSPQLFWPIGIMFLTGLYISLRKSQNSFLVIWLLIMALPGILTYEGVPHSLRVIGVIPAVYILAALGGQHLCRWLKDRLKNKRLLALSCFVFLNFLIFAQFNKYFILWSQNPNTQDAFSKDFVCLGNYLNSLSADVQKYIIVNMPGVSVPLPDGISVSAQTPMFIERTKWNELRAEYIKSDQIDEIRADERETVIIPMKYDPILLTQLQEKFPRGIMENKNGILIFNIQKNN